MKKYILLLFLIASSVNSYSQIGVYTEMPDKSSILDITSIDKGLLIPRMTTSQKQAIKTSESEKGLVVYDTSLNCVSLFTNLPWLNNQLGWTCLGSNEDNFFYMPSININTSVLGVKTLNLYNEYSTQFSTPLNKSNSTASLDTYKSNELYYYVTYYDKTKIKINTISSEGLMNYEVIGHADYDSYMNVIFVVR